MWNMREVLSFKIILSSLNATITVWHFPSCPVSEISPWSFDVKNDLCSVSSTRLNRLLRKCKDNSSVFRYSFLFSSLRCNLANWRCKCWWKENLQNFYKSIRNFALNVFPEKQKINEKCILPLIPFFFVK